MPLEWRVRPGDGSGSYVRITVRQPNSLLRYGGYTFSVGGARLIGLSITSLTFPYIVRHLGVETYGVWSYVVAIRTFLDIAADPGIANYATQQVAARRKEAFRIIPDVLLLRAICSLAALVIVLVVARFEARGDVRQLLLFYCIGSLPASLVSSEAFLSSLELFHVRSLLM